MIHQLLKIYRSVCASTEADVLILSAGKSGSTYLTHCIGDRDVYHVHSLISDFYFKYEKQSLYERFRYRILRFFAKVCWNILKKQSFPRVILFPYRKNDEHRTSLFFNDLEDFVYEFKKNYKEKYRNSRYQGANEFLSIVLNTVVAQNPTKRCFLEWQYILGEPNLVFPYDDNAVYDIQVESFRVYFVPSHLLTRFVEQHEDIFNKPKSEKINQSEEFWWSDLFSDFKQRVK